MAAGLTSPRLAISGNHLMEFGMSKGIFVSALVAAALVVGCGGDSPSATPGSSAGQPLTPARVTEPLPGGKVIEVEMITEGTGNFFRPAEFEANRGDMIRFVNKVGVHNVSFPADSNPGARNLPPPTDLLQLPGQVVNILVDWEPGSYFYQCDPHALIGMVGRITVH